MSRSQKLRAVAKKYVSPARSAALSVLESVLTDGKTLLDRIPDLNTLCADERDLALARDIVSGTCRWQGRIRYILLQTAPRFDNFPPTIQRILEMSVYQLLYLDRTPDYAVLSEAVELARIRKFAGLASAVNGILRTITRTKGAVVFPDADKDFAAHLAAVHSHPLWLIDRWLSIWPEEEVRSFCEFNNTIAPLSLRARGDRDAATHHLTNQGIAAHSDLRFPNRIVLDSESHLSQELFEASDWIVQDGAAMLIAPLIDPQPNWKIWDVCAAPGGKMAHLADLTQNQASILASDHSADRLQKVDNLIEKLGIRNATTQKIDALQKLPPLEVAGFDAILVDAPCSGWGTFRRHPDLRWRLQSNDAKKFGKQALQILENVQTYLRVGGVLVYGTCTLSPEENEQVVFAFLEKHPEFGIESTAPFLPDAFLKAQTKEGFLSIFPPEWNMDGAFAARLRKR